MNSVGIIVHSASGKDIRRIIAKGSTATNQEKANSVIRMISAMDSLGVAQVKIMPDTTGIGRRIVKELDGQLQHCHVSLLELPFVLGSQSDTVRAAQMMHNEKFACVIVMGGDGTCRVAAKGSGNTPMIPVSTGTNNVFPQVVEGTLVGIAAGYIATEKVNHKDCCFQKPLLRLKKDGEIKDIALVDLVTVNSTDKASRAVWEIDSIMELFLTHASPNSIGLSSIGGWLDPLSPEDGVGLYIETAAKSKGDCSTKSDEDYTEVLAPIAPGLLEPVPIKQHHRFDAQQELPIKLTPCVVALDGEREITISAGEQWSIEYCENGPVVVDIEKTFQAAISAPKGKTTLL